MKILTPLYHGYLDYGVVLIFLLAPTVLGLSGIPAIIAYTLAVVHLALTLATDFPLGRIRLVPLKIHGFIELIVSIALLLLPWILQFSNVPIARNFYVVMGGLIFAVWLITAYSGKQNITA
jgi:hypothetical protein